MAPSHSWVDTASCVLQAHIDITNVMERTSSPYPPTCIVLVNVLSPWSRTPTCSELRPSYFDPWHWSGSVWAGDPGRVVTAAAAPSPHSPHTPLEKSRSIHLLCVDVRVWCVCCVWCVCLGVVCVGVETGNFRQSLPWRCWRFSMGIHYGYHYALLSFSWMGWAPCSHGYWSSSAVCTYVPDEDHSKVAKCWQVWILMEETCDTIFACPITLLDWKCQRRSAKVARFWSPTECRQGRRGNLLITYKIIGMEGVARYYLSCSDQQLTT